MDVFEICALFQMVNAAKSTAIPLALLKMKDLSVEEAVQIARVDENHQSSVFGKVEGAHDLDEAYVSQTFATAKTYLKLRSLEEISWT